MRTSSLSMVHRYIGLIVSAMLLSTHVFASEAAGWHEDVSQALLIHDSTGFAFPQKSGNLLRKPPHNYNAAGTDVSIDYNDDKRKLLVTLYVYPQYEASLRDELKGVMDAIGHRFDDVHFVQFDSFHMPLGVYDATPGAVGVGLTAKIQGNDVESLAFLVPWFGNRTVFEVRATWPRNDFLRDQTFEEINGLLHQVQLPPVPKHVPSDAKAQVREGVAYLLDEPAVVLETSHWGYANTANPFLLVQDDKENTFIIVSRFRSGDAFYEGGPIIPSELSDQSLEQVLRARLGEQGGVSVEREQVGDRHTVKATYYDAKQERQKCDLVFSVQGSLVHVMLSARDMATFSDGYKVAQRVVRTLQPLPH